MEVDLQAHACLLLLIKKFLCERDCWLFQKVCAVCRVSLRSPCCVFMFCICSMLFAQLNASDAGAE